MRGELQQPADWAPAIRQRVERFLFQAPQWVQPEALVAQVPDNASLAGAFAFMEERSWSSHQVQILAARLAPIHGIQPHRLMGGWQARLALLDASEWTQLGFAISALPYGGQAQRSMDGHFRRALREQLGADAPQRLDALAGQLPPALKFRLGPGAWKQPQQVAWGGVRAAWDQVCTWDPAVRTRAGLGFKPEVLQSPASVVGLDEVGLEMACKLIWDEHPWLWS